MGFDADVAEVVGWATEGGVGAIVVALGEVDGGNTFGAVVVSTASVSVVVGTADDNGEVDAGPIDATASVWTEAMSALRATVVGVEDAIVPGGVELHATKASAVSGSIAYGRASLCPPALLSRLTDQNASSRSEVVGRGAWHSMAVHTPRLRGLTEGGR